jgi:ABC-2 type transporter
MTSFSWQRLLAIFIKEFQQMLRDRLTFAMAIGVPIMQLVLFGYAINTGPKGIGYFKVMHAGTTEREAEALIEDGDAQVMVVIPNDFTQRVLRGVKPAVRNQLQATQMTFSFFLPSMLLCGFMLQFRGMPGRAQTLGEVLPLIHFLRIVRGIMLKGHDVAHALPELWPLLAFLFVAGAVALRRYRQTLD